MPTNRVGRFWPFPVQEALVLFGVLSCACRTDPARTREAGIAALPNPSGVSLADANSEPVHDASAAADAHREAPADASSTRYRLTTIAGHDAAVIPEALAADYLEAVLFDRSGDPPLRRSSVARGRVVTGYFSPDDACVERLEAGLEAFLKKRPHTPIGLASKQRSYKRQYAGFRTDGRRVYAAFLCRELHAMEWGSFPYYARWIGGGGDCFFDVVFGCEDGLYSDFATSN